VSAGNGQQPSQGAVHLVPAGELFRQGFGPAVAVRGELITSGAGGEDDPRYCFDCVASATRWNATADDREPRLAVVR
jgi:hypothetical protein